MPPRKPNPLHSAAPRPRCKPRIYNRPWHLDADRRRHRGRRKWDPAAVEALIALAGKIEWLYPPDFSARDVVRFRGSGCAESVADLRTGRPDCLRLILRLRKSPPTAASLRRLKVPVQLTPRGLELRLLSRQAVLSPAFARFFTNYITTMR